MEQLGAGDKQLPGAIEFVEKYLVPNSPDPNDPTKSIHYPMPDFHKDLLTAAETRRWMLVLVPREFSKSTIITVGYSTYRIVENRNVCGGIISNTYDQAASFLGGVQSHLEANPDVIDEFGTFKDDGSWRSDYFTVVRGNRAEINPTMFAAGAGKAILGKHTDFLVMDDVEDKKTVITPDSRKKTQTWYTQTVIPILRSHGQMIFIGTRKHWDDLYINILNGNLPGPKVKPIVMDGEETGTSTLALPKTIVEEHGWLTFPEFKKPIKENGESLWPERWSLEALAERRDAMGPIAWAQEMENNPVPEDNSYFTLAKFEECYHPGLTFQMEYHGSNPIFIGVDSQVSLKSGADFGCIYVIEFDPVTENRKILWIERGRWGFRIADRIAEFDLRYKPTKVIVENNAAQDFIVQHMKTTTLVPVEGFTTGDNKPDIYIGIPYLAATIDSGKWIIPRGGPRELELTDQWVKESLEYGQGHSGDVLMASWFANDGAREISRLGFGSLPSPKEASSGERDLNSSFSGTKDEGNVFSSAQLSRQVSDLNRARGMFSPHTRNRPEWSPRNGRRFNG